MEKRSVQKTRGIQDARDIYCSIRRSREPRARHWPGYNAYPVNHFLRVKHSKTSILNFLLFALFISTRGRYNAYAAQHHKSQLPVEV